MTRLIPRVKRIELTGEYAGVWVDMHANPPMSIFDDMASKDKTLVQRALAKLVRASNLEDEEGAPIDLHAADGWGKVPIDFWQEIANRIAEAFEVPKVTSRESTTGSSGTTPEGSPAITTS